MSWGCFGNKKKEKKMFVINEFYKTKNGSKVACANGPDKDGYSRMKVISGGHGVRERSGSKPDEIYWVTSTGEFREAFSRNHEKTTKLQGMDVIGPWEKTPKLTLTFETEAQKEAFLAWFLDAGGDQDMRAFSSEDYPECPNLASYDRDNKTINFSHHKGE